MSGESGARCNTSGECSVGLRNVGLPGHEPRPLRRRARRLGVGVASLLVLTGTTIVFDASSFVSGSAAPTESLSCNDTWTGSGSTDDWRFGRQLDGRGTER